jgi:hypothetical protein
MFMKFWWQWEEAFNELQKVLMEVIPNSLPENLHKRIEILRLTYRSVATDLPPYYMNTCDCWTSSCRYSPLFRWSSYDDPRTPSESTTMDYERRPRYFCKTPSFTF